MLLAFLTGIMLGFLVLPAWGNAQGERLYQTQGCAICHGKGGARPIAGLVPKLAGQNAEYLILQLREFKATKRTGAGAQAMWTFAQSLSQNDIRLISDYLEKSK